MQLMSVSIITRYRINTQYKSLMDKKTAFNFPNDNITFVSVLSMYFKSITTSLYNYTRHVYRFANRVTRVIVTHVQTFPTVKTTASIVLPVPVHFLINMFQTTKKMPKHYLNQMNEVH